MLDPNQIFKEKSDAALRALTVEFKPSRNWYQAAGLALTLSSPIQLGIRASELKELKEKAHLMKKINYYEFAILSNNLEAKSEYHLGLAGGLCGGYDDVMIEAEKLAEEWNKVVEPLHKKIAEEINAELRKAAAQQMKGNFLKAEA